MAPATAPGPPARRRHRAHALELPSGEGEALDQFAYAGHAPVIWGGPVLVVRPADEPPAAPPPATPETLSTGSPGR